MPTANQRISEYVLEERLGGGAFGEVWKARHHVWQDQVVAIKIPLDGQYIRNLQREGRAIHGLSHSNIVRAIGFDPYADPPYLIMEYVPGSSLRPLIKDWKLTVEDAVAILRQVLAGLAHAHKNNVVHRDIKPENILVDNRAMSEGYAAEGVIKVTDFGLGKAATISAAESIALSASLGSEEAERISGTFDYMAPEQRGGEQIDQRCDLYACGVILYEMLTGERPAGTDVPGDLNKNVPKYLDEAFRHSYARLEKRFNSAEEFLGALVPPMPGRMPPPVPESQIETAHANGQMRLCPGCRREVNGSDQFCMHCGAQLVEWVLRCPQCGAYPDPTDRFCIFCGVALTPQATA